MANTQKTYKGEFNFKIWTLKFNNLTYNIFTAKNKGTSIEINDVDHEDIRLGKYDKEIIEFLTELQKEILIPKGV